MSGLAKLPESDITEDQIVMKAWAEIASDKNSWNNLGVKFFNKPGSNILKFAKSVLGIQVKDEEQTFKLSLSDILKNKDWDNSDNETRAQWVTTNPFGELNVNGDNAIVLSVRYEPPGWVNKNDRGVSKSDCLLELIDLVKDWPGFDDAGWREAFSDANEYISFTDDDKSSWSSMANVIEEFLNESDDEFDESEKQEFFNMASKFRAMDLSSNSKKNKI